MKLFKNKCPNCNEHFFMPAIKAEQKAWFKYAKQHQVCPHCHCKIQPDKIFRMLWSTGWLLFSVSAFAPTLGAMEYGSAGSWMLLGSTALIWIMALARGKYVLGG